MTTVPPSGPTLDDVYGTDSLVQQESPSDESNSGIVMSDRVQALAAKVYEEFQNMIKAYGDDVVKNVMPLIVNVLETLNNSLSEKSEIEADYDLLKEDNQQLLCQFEREKQLRKSVEERYLESEDLHFSERSQLVNRIEVLESSTRMQEMKAKNAVDQIARLEEKEGEQQSEYEKLRIRYTDLFRAHCEQVERAKYTSKRDSSTTSEVDFNMVASGVRTADLAAHDLTLPEDVRAKQIEALDRIGMSSDERLNLRGKSLEREIRSPVHRVQVPSSRSCLSLDNVDEEFEALAEQDDDMIESPRVQADDQMPKFKSSKEESGGNYSIAFAEDDFTGVGKEVQNLISENTDLLNTKNALNVVKNDLIMQMEQQGQQLEMVRNELMLMQVSREKALIRCDELEVELRSVRDKYEQLRKEKEAEDEKPSAERKRFTRVEMARVLMERNQYKEQLMQLQEAVRWTELVRASKEHDFDQNRRNRGGLWAFFSNLTGAGSPGKARRTTNPSIKFDSGGRVKPVEVSDETRQAIEASLLSDSHDFVRDDPILKRLPNVADPRRRRNIDGRFQAYGWSLPSSLHGTMTASAAKGPPPVPVPVASRHIADAVQASRVWCGASVIATPRKSEPSTVQKGDATNRKRKSDSNITSSSSQPPSSVYTSCIWLLLASPVDQETGQRTCRVVICDVTIANSSDVVASFPIDVPEVGQVLCINSIPAASHLPDDPPAAAGSGGGGGAEKTARLNNEEFLETVIFAGGDEPLVLFNSHVSLRSARC